MNAAPVATNMTASHVSIVVLEAPVKASLAGMNVVVVNLSPCGEVVGVPGPVVGGGGVVDGLVVGGDVVPGVVVGGDVVVGDVVGGVVVPGVVVGGVAGTGLHPL